MFPVGATRWVALVGRAVKHGTLPHQGDPPGRPYRISEHLRLLPPSCILDTTTAQSHALKSHAGIFRFR